MIESTLENPRQVLSAQQFRARGEAVAQMKADGVGYEERLELLDDVTYPQPLADLLDGAYEIYRRGHPWVADFELKPKSVVRDMYERAMTFVPPASGVAPEVLLQELPVTGVVGAEGEHVEALLAGVKRVRLGHHAARFQGGAPGVLQGTYSYVLQDEAGRVVDVVAAALKELLLDDFACILVITHIQELKDEFPTRIEVVRTAAGFVRTRKRSSGSGDLLQDGQFQHGF